MRQNHNGGLLLSRVPHHHISRFLQNANTSDNSTSGSDDDNSSGLLFPDSDVGTTVTLQNQYAVTYNVIPVSYVGVQCRRENRVPLQRDSDLPHGTLSQRHLHGAQHPRQRELSFLQRPAILQDAQYCAARAGVGRRIRRQPLCSTTAFTDTTTKCECQAPLLSIQRQWRLTQMTPPSTALGASWGPREGIHPILGTAKPADTAAPVVLLQ